MGDLKYLENGQEVEVVSGEGPYIVRAVLDLDDEPYFGERFIVNKVFDKPPVAHLHESITKLREEKAKLDKELFALREEIKDARYTRSQLDSLFNTNRQTQVLKAFLENRITYVVVKSDYKPPSILTLEDMLNPPNNNGYDWEKGPRLVNLFGNSNGDLSWRVNRWKDDSGSWTQVEFFEWEQQALDYVQEWINSVKADRLSLDKLIPIEDLAKKHDLILPDSIKRAIATQTIKKVKEKLWSAENAFNNLSQEYDKVKERFSEFADWAKI